MAKNKKKGKKNKEATTPAAQESHPCKMINGSINLTAFKSIKSQMKNKIGKKVDVLIIPLEANNLEENKKNGNIYLNITAWANKTPSDFSTHMIKQNLSKDVREALTKDELYALPILGNLNALIETGYKEANNSTTVAAKELETAIEEVDDLPF